MGRLYPDDAKARFEEFLDDSHASEVQAFADQHPDRLQFTFRWSDLEEFDPELARAYRTNPTKIQEPIDRALQFSDIHNAICLSNAWAYPSTPPVEFHLHALPANQIGSIVGIPVQMNEIDDTNASIRVGGYRCRTCEALQSMFSLHDEPSAPYYCSACERKRTEFVLDDEYTHYIDRCSVTVTDAAHLLYNFEHPTSINAEFIGPVASELELGEWYRCVGVLSGELDESGRVSKHLIVGEASPDDPKEIKERLPVGEDSLDAPTTDTSHLAAFQTADIDLQRHHLAGFVTHVQDLVNEYGSRSQMTEEDVKVKIINPLLELLGWDVFKSEVRFEYPVVVYESHKAVDYALMDGREPVVCIEAKSPSKPVARNALDQLYEYMIELDAEWGLLTNGWTYRLIRKGASSTPNQLAEFTVELVPNHLELLENYAREAIV